MTTTARPPAASTSRRLLSSEHMQNILRTQCIISASLRLTMNGCASKRTTSLWDGHPRGKWSSATQRPPPACSRTCVRGGVPILQRSQSRRSAENFRFFDKHSCIRGRLVGARLHEHVHRVGRQDGGQGHIRALHSSLELRVMAGTKIKRYASPKRPAAFSKSLANAKTVRQCDSATRALWMERARCTGTSGQSWRSKQSIS
jgi:hypothetical protein